MSSDPFHYFRKRTVGYNVPFASPYGILNSVYADWTATGKLYLPIEQAIQENFGPLYANTHSGTTFSAQVTTEAYGLAAELIKSSVGANEQDVLVPCGTGATAAINKLQRILGLRIPEQLKQYVAIPAERKPIIFITHMEHHSNHTSWLETIGDVVVIPPDENGLVDASVLREHLEEHRDREVKIGSFTACSNVTGIMTPLAPLAQAMHEYGGVCFADCSASAPYVPIDMHPANPEARLDAIFLSPHKFLGGPGSCGLLLFHEGLYANTIPDHPGGGTVKWTNPWGGKAYVDDIATREDGGTPGILQLIRAAMAFQVKDQLMQCGMRSREKSISARLQAALQQVPRLHLLADHVRHNLPIFSFTFSHLHYNLVVRLLNDRFGIQARGGCSCAGTYGHYLLNIQEHQSAYFTDLIDHADLSAKPGWVRISLHPIMRDSEIDYIIEALHQISDNGREWSQDYTYNRETNEFLHKHPTSVQTNQLFSLHSPHPGMQTKRR